VYATFGEIDQFSTDCVSKYEDALVEAGQKGIRVKALLICNPHNPLGRCYPKETLAALMKFCDKHQIHLVSDEVYALSVFQVEGRKVDDFVSALSVDPWGLIRTDQIHVLYGLSKVQFNPIRSGDECY
jgi:xeroderma pigmentosum group C-complementing protein